MRLIEIYYDGSSFGRIRTSAPTTGTYARVIRLEDMEMVDLAALAADCLGEEQPCTWHLASNLAKWIIHYGMHHFGERPFRLAVAQALIWHRGIYETSD